MLQHGSGSGNKYEKVCLVCRKIEVEPPSSFFPSKHEIPRLIVVLAIASAVAWTCNFFFTSVVNPLAKPFCDSNLESPEFFSDDCEPCPSNGACNSGQLECLQGYQRRGKLCIEDGDINESAKKISERVEDNLCEDYAQYLCYGTGSVWAQEDEIWSRFDHFEPTENILLDNALYNYTKQRAVETMSKLLEMRTNYHGVKEFKCPDLLAEHYKPYTCRIHQWVSQNILVVLPTCVMLVGCTFFIWKVHRKLHMSRRAEELYNQACEILEENALMSKNVNGECEPWVVASRLRDHLLLPRERKDPLLWKKVEELVQEDSRVDRFPKLVKGESKVVWEWQVEGSLSSSKIKRKIDASKMRVSKGTDLRYQQHPAPKTEPKELNF
ncbi:Inner nuclear membrane protein MAN1 [Senna tora]|uniref:Inner nuclear membrane protein MAN1 n=1 Tax=Senna tora TaxID=362788 RepID=A0A834W542_9FABA|nr:Inner nuclear membrane protein MAN1 [Senna tora]